MVRLWHTDKNIRKNSKLFVTANISSAKTATKFPNITDAKFNPPSAFLVGTKGLGIEVLHVTVSFLLLVKGGADPFVPPKIIQFWCSARYEIYPRNYRSLLNFMLDKSLKGPKNSRETLNPSLWRWWNYVNTSSRKEPGLEAGAWNLKLGLGSGAKS